MDILGLLPKTINGNQHVINITDSDSKLTETVLTPRFTTTAVA